jgi:hypothetical protein
MWYLIIFFVAAAGGGAGGDIETLEFASEAKCRAAAAIIEQEKPSNWSSVSAVCVEHD